MAPQGVGYPAPDSLYRSLELLETFIGEIVNAYPIDPARLYAGGFSQGGAMAASLIMTLPHRIAGGMILSGYLPLHADLPFQPEAAAGHPVFQAHGTYDPVIPVLWARETRDYLASTPVDLTYREYPMAHSTSLPEMQDVDVWLSGVLTDTSASG
jgi:phospholipase/carboxylesterase